MPGRVVTKVISAAVVALVVELTELALARTALSADRYRVVRKILKSGAGVATNALLGMVLRQPEQDDAGAPAAGADQPAPDAEPA